MDVGAFDLFMASVKFSTAWLKCKYPIEEAVHGLKFSKQSMAIRTVVKSINGLKLKRKESLWQFDLCCTSILLLVWV